MHQNEELILDITKHNAAGQHLQIGQPPAFQKTQFLDLHSISTFTNRVFRQNFHSNFQAFASPFYIYIPVIVHVKNCTLHKLSMSPVNHPSAAVSNSIAKTVNSPHNIA